MLGSKFGTDAWWLLASCHLLCKHCDELCEVDGAWCLCQHVGSIRIRDGLAHVGECTLKCGVGKMCKKATSLVTIGGQGEGEGVGFP